jgi:hypothetical protein
MKKPILLLVIIVAMFGKLQAQEENFLSNSTSKTELGINVTELINAVFANNTNSLNKGLFLASYKYIKNNAGLRLGLGIRYASQTTDDFITKRSSDELNTSIRIGYEWQKAIANRWLYYGGFDIIGTYGFENSSSDNGTGLNTIKAKNSGFGLGPILGFQFFINKRLSLGVETSLYYRSVSTKSSFELVGNPIPTPQTNTSQSSFDLASPQSLFLIVKL